MSENLGRLWYISEFQSSEPLLFRYTWCYAGLLHILETSAALWTNKLLTYHKPCCKVSKFIYCICIPVILSAWHGLLCLHMRFCWSTIVCHTVMTLSFRTDGSGQTVQTQIRLLLEEQSDQILHRLLFHLHLLKGQNSLWFGLFVWILGSLLQHFLVCENLGT